MNPGPGQKVHPHVTTHSCSCRGRGAHGDVRLRRGDRRRRRTTLHRHSSASTRTHPGQGASPAHVGEGAGGFFIAVFGSGQSARSTLSGPSTALKAEKRAVLDTGPTAVATSINPVGGLDGLRLGNTDDQIFAAKRLRNVASHARQHHRSLRVHRRRRRELQHVLLQQRRAGRVRYCDRRLPRGNLQLIRKKGHWKIDKRVKFPGLNDAGSPTGPDGSTFVTAWLVGTLFDSVVHRTQGPAQRQVPRPELSTANKETWATTRSWSSPAWAPRSRRSWVSRIDCGSLATQPRHQAGLGCRTMAMPAWPSSRAPPTRRWSRPGLGFAVLGLGDLLHPKLEQKATIGGASNTNFYLVSLTISRDGDHVWVAWGDRDLCVGERAGGDRPRAAVQKAGLVPGVHPRRRRDQ